MKITFYRSKFVRLSRWLCFGTMGELSRTIPLVWVLLPNLQKQDTLSIRDLFKWTDFINVVAICGFILNKAS